MLLGLSAEQEETNIRRGCDNIICRAYSA